MKSIIPSILLIVFLAACGSPAPATVTATMAPTQTEPPIVTQTVPPIVTQTEPSITTLTQPPFATLTEPPITTLTQPPFATATPTSTPPPNSVQACVLPYRLTVRTGPGTTYDVAGVIKRSTCIYAIARNPNNTWFWEVSNAANGWVSGAYLSPKGNLNSLPLMSEITQTPGAVIQNPSPTATIQP
ncbi:MAG: hypothetical protein ABSA01_01140 [Anaerolineales bacterium]